MMDFGQWFARSARETPVPAADAADILEKMGLDLMNDGRVMGDCERCGRRICWTDYLSLNDIVKDGIGYQLCGAYGCTP